MPKNPSRSTPSGRPSGGRKAGSLSPKHRGHRADEAPGKNRWSTARRDEARGARPAEGAPERSDRRPDWTPPEHRPTRARVAGQPKFGARAPERGRGGWQRDDRAPERSDRNDRGDRSYGGDRNDRGDRSYGGDRSDRGYGADRGDRSFGGDRRSEGQRPERRNDERPARSFGTDRRQEDRRPERRNDERPARRFEERPAHGFNRGSAGQREERRSAERPERRFEERPPRSFDGDRRSEGARPERRFEERPARSFDRDARPQRRSDDRPARRFEDTDRPARRFEDTDRPARRYERTDRPVRRSEDTDRPARRYEDTDRPVRRSEERPERRFGGPREDVRPHREAPAGQRERRFHDFQDRARGPRHDDFRDTRRSSDGRPDRKMSDVDDVVLERLEAVATTAAEVQGVTFADLGLGSNIVHALSDLGAEVPFPIQAATIPDVLAGRNVLGRGRTGSGKTIAFGAPLVERILQSQAGTKRALGRPPRALILAPTRELALQIDSTVQPIARSVGLFTTQIYGGVPQARQVGALRRGVDIVIGTPGRIEDLVQQGALDLSDVQIVVLDEADHMTDLGFLEPVQRILRLTRDDGQRLLFSATLDSAVAALVDEFLVDPAVHEVAGEDQKSSTIEHRVLLIDQKDKLRLVTELVDGPGKSLVFARTRAFAEQLAEELSDAGIPATSLHGDLNQAKRSRNLERLTSGRVNVLVATDVAARGIHVDDIELVIQADAPEEYKTYLHRSGRTGRAGKLGSVVTLIAKSRRRRLEELLDRAEITADFLTVPLGGDVPRELAGR